MKTKNKVLDEPIITYGKTLKRNYEFRGKIYRLTLHFKTATRPEFTYDMIDRVTNEQGNEVVGRWHWGTYGRLHTEPLEFETRDSAADKYALFTTGSWCNGRQKNGRKTLVDIIEKSA